MIYAPVCTKKGATRSNQCVAECKGEKVAYEGPCKPKTAPAVVEETSEKDNVTATATTAADMNATVASAVDEADASAKALNAPGEIGRLCVASFFFSQYPVSGCAEMTVTVRYSNLGEG
jgi:hypothetical protein